MNVFQIHLTCSISLQKNVKVAYIDKESQIIFIDVVQVLQNIPNKPKKLKTKNLQQQALLPYTIT